MENRIVHSTGWSQLQSARRRRRFLLLSALVPHLCLSSSQGVFRANRYFLLIQALSLCSNAPLSRWGKDTFRREVASARPSAGITRIRFKGSMATKPSSQPGSIPAPRQTFRHRPYYLRTGPLLHFQHPPNRPDYTRPSVRLGVYQVKMSDVVEFDDRGLLPQPVSLFGEDF